MSRGGKRKNQTGRPKKPYRVKRMSVPEPLVERVQEIIHQFNLDGLIWKPITLDDISEIRKSVYKEMYGLPNQKEA